MGVANGHGVRPPQPHNSAFPADLMLETPLHDWHAAHGGRLVDFAGWAMPVQYATITAEHHAVRQAAGLFDISHMGRLRLDGEAAVPLVEQLVTCGVAKLAPGQIRYGLVTNEAGGILDDILVYRLTATELLLVVNASNREKIAAWIQQHCGAASLEVRDETFQTGMIAVQGPRAAAVLVAAGADNTAGMRYYRSLSATVAGIPVLASRTGYTGEDGFELIVAADRTAELWAKLLAVGGSTGLQPCGLGCRDTLRLEAGMPLYGHELSESLDPISAGLQFAVDFTTDFIGRTALTAIATQQPERVRVGLVLDGKRIARENTRLFSGGVEIGQVTSGTFSPTLEQSIAMAYVAASQSDVGNILEADLRGRRETARVVPLPFYKRPVRHDPSITSSAGTAP